nr:PilN domain-containing protein [candidate division Zixibacteria bacterium]
MAMININLLPKQYMKRSGGFSLGKQGIYAVIAAAGVILMFGAITGWQLYKINELNGQMAIARARTLQLEKDIKLVDALMDIKAKITDRLEAVERLDRHRSAWVRILEDLSSDVPDFVWLSKFNEAKKQAPVKKDKNDTTSVQPATNLAVIPAEIEGFTFTLNALASFMIKLMRSDYFDEVDLVNTEEIVFGKQKAYNFKLSCNVHYLSDEELEKLAVQQAAGSESKIN